MKLRSDSTLAELTEDQREQLFDWLSTNSAAKVQTLAAKPVADGGFDLKIHRTTLDRFFESQVRERQALELAALAAGADNATTPVEIEQLLAGTRVKFVRATFELAKAAADPDNYDRLENALHHMDLIKARREELEIEKRKLDLDEKRFAEQKRQWEFDIMREVMKHFLEYEKLHRRTDIDQHDKLWAGRTICFGPGSDAPILSSTSHLLPSESGVHPDSPGTVESQSPSTPEPSLASFASVENPQSANLQPLAFSLQPSLGAPHSATLQHDKLNSTSSEPGPSLPSFASVENSPSGKSELSAVKPSTPEN